MRAGSSLSRARPIAVLSSARMRSPTSKTPTPSRSWRPTTVAVSSPSYRKTAEAFTSSTRAVSSETAVKTRARVASYATRVAPDHILARVAGRALTRVVEEENPALRVEHADERLRGLRENSGEVVAEDELGAHVRRQRASLRTARAQAASRRRSPWSARSDGSLRRRSPA